MAVSSLIIMYDGFAILKGSNATSGFFKIFATNSPTSRPVP